LHLSYEVIFGVVAAAFSIIEKHDQMVRAFGRDKIAGSWGRAIPKGCGQLARPPQQLFGPTDVWNRRRITR
jgi:hypothetical protein